MEIHRLSPEAGERPGIRECCSTSDTGRSVFSYFSWRMSSSPGWQSWTFIIELTWMEKMLTCLGSCYPSIRHSKQLANSQVSLNSSTRSSRDFSWMDWELSWGGLLPSH